MTTAIKGWRERAGLPASYEITGPSSVERALLEEIAELRAKNEIMLRAIQRIAGTNASQHGTMGMMLERCVMIALEAQA